MGKLKNIAEDYGRWKNKTHHLSILITTHIFCAVSISSLYLWLHNKCWRTNVHGNADKWKKCLQTTRKNGNASIATSWGGGQAFQDTEIKGCLWWWLMQSIQLPSARNQREWLVRLWCWISSVSYLVSVACYGIISGPQWNKRRDIQLLSLRS